jgi:hypothetical protein
MLAFSEPYVLSPPSSQTWILQDAQPRAKPIKKVSAVPIKKVSAVSSVMVLQRKQQGPAMGRMGTPLTSFQVLVRSVGMGVARYGVTPIATVQRVALPSIATASTLPQADRMCRVAKRCSDVSR